MGPPEKSPKKVNKDKCSRSYLFIDEKSNLSKATVKGVEAGLEFRKSDSRTHILTAMSYS